jgi:DNA-directed RNA polymerase beta subunit
MTIGQLKETREGKAAALAGVRGDATAHRPNSTIKLQYMLKTGEEAMYDGETGEMYKDPVFIGVAAYEVLRHFTMDKYHARPVRGPVSLMTRQPLAGRAQNGGFRNGQMEKDAMLSHGASALVNERFFSSSDGREIYACRTCGTLSWLDADGAFQCGNRACAEPGALAKYSGNTFMLLLHELRAAGILYSIRA